MIYMTSDIGFDFMILSFIDSDVIYVRGWHYEKEWYEIFSHLTWQKWWKLTIKLLEELPYVPP